MKELLAPVGNKEAFYAAIANGCDAVYLGLDKYNARAYAENFNLQNLQEYVDFAHLRNVRVFVTLNTIAYDHELEEIYSMIDELAKIKVDAIIVQDLAVLVYAVNNYKSLEVHASTQMGIDDYFGAKLLKDIGVKRVVLARETPIQIIKDIKERANIEVESFIHGALCVSYSGNCFMSAAIGERSGNRGRCAGCCRKQYSLINLDTKQNIKTGYLLSMKDLNLSSHIDEMNFIDSFKIEGRMKEEAYVAAVTNTYRKIIDNEPYDKETLDKVFNRTYTKGFINNEDSKNITNINRPNNNGFLIGKVTKVNNNKVWIKLFKDVKQGDHIRIENENSLTDINMVLTKMFDSDFKPVESSNKVIVVYTDKKVKLNALVFKTKDLEFYSNVNVGNRIKEYKKLGINVSISIKLDEPILLKVSYKEHTVYQKSEFITTKALKVASTESDVFNHLSKMNDTPYFIENFDIELDKDVFVPVKVLNDLRRAAITKLNNSRLNKKLKLSKESIFINPKNYDYQKPKLSIEVSTKEQYYFVKNLGYENVYFKNIVRRNNCQYVEDEEEVLIGGLSSIEYYKNKDVTLVSDYSFNVNNCVSAAFLSSLGVDRITLSSELNKYQIDALVKKYIDTYETYPNFEMIVYGRATLMHSKYCPLRKLDMCGKCRSGKFALKDEFESFPLRFNDDCTINLLNGRTLNLLDEINNINGINYFRLVFTTESIDEIKQIIDIASKKLEGIDTPKSFDERKHTRGNFKKQLL